MMEDDTYAAITFEDCPSHTQEELDDFQEVLHQDYLKFEKKIIEAIGNDKKFMDMTNEDPDFKKREFAEEIFNKLEHKIIDAQERQKLIEYRKELFINSSKAIESFEALTLSRKKAGIECLSITPLTKFVTNSLSNDFDFEDVVSALKIYHSLLSHLNFDEKQRGPQTKSDWEIGKFLAEIYQKHFNSNPTAIEDRGEKNKDDTPKRSPFDRVCKVINTSLGLQITPGMRRKICDEVKGG